MLTGLPRRKRLLLLTAALSLLFLAGAAVLVAWLRAPEPPYRPGEEIEGITARLARALPDDHPRVRFADVSEEAGIRFDHFGGRRSSQLPEDMGSGAAWGDYDNDGWPDLFVVNVAGPLILSEEEVARSPARAHLYRNLGLGPDGRHRGFQEVGEEAGVDFRGWGMAAAWGDYDNDGWLDLVVTAYGEIVLYRNDGDGTFTDVSREAGFGGFTGFWSGATWCDVDRDGFLDLYVTGYVKYDPRTAGETSLQWEVAVPASLNPSSFAPERNLLFRSNGDGTFTEVAEQAGVADPAGRGLATACADLDEDGWPDLYVANDVSDNRLYRNRGNGTFEDLSYRALVADYRGSMGLALGDWDGHGDTDLFITHWIAQENAFYVNRLRPGFLSLDAPPPNALQFMDLADRWGLGQVSLDHVGWGAFFFDYDNDGRLDLFVANGSTLQEPAAPHLLVSERDRLFWNGGAERGFYDVSEAAGPYFMEEHVGRGAAFADYDGDGYLDVFVANHGGRGVLLRNQGGSRNRWLKLRLEGTRSNRSAIGARIRLVSEGSVQVREVGSQPSYLSGNDLVVHFGLGGRGEADSLEIRWPSGLRQMLRDVPGNRFLHVVEGSEGWEEVTVAGPGGREAAAGAALPDEGAFGDGREEVRRFWELYRAAAAHRVAWRHREAAEVYEAALRLNPVHEDALYYLGNTRFELGEFAAAERAWLRLTEVNPRSGRAHAQLGTLHACFEENPAFDLERAEREFRRVLEINPEQIGALLDLATVALARGDHRAAGRRLDAVLGSDPGNALALRLKGYLAWKVGDGESALALFSAAGKGETGVGPAGASAEGDTREGARPLVTRRSPCRGIRTWEEEAAGAEGRWERARATGRDEAARRVEMERRYRELAAFLSRAQGG